MVCVKLSIPGVTVGKLASEDEKKADGVCSSNSSRVCAHKAGLIRKYGLLVCRQVRIHSESQIIKEVLCGTVILMDNVLLQCFREKASDIGFIKVHNIPQLFLHPRATTWLCFDR